MILAAPLVVPFAEAVGLSVATLGMAKVADMVNEYIQENPEQSMKILSTIVPGVGIGEIFMKKDKDEEVEEDIEVEDVDARDLTREEKAKEMKKRFKEGTGDKREIGKKGYEEIILPGKEDEMLDEAEDRYEGGVEEVSKPKFDYKKFFKKRYADGGSIGIEVLFEEKKPRKNFFMGGPALDGQALSIYNSMNSYGFSDQEIANALQAQGLYTPGVEEPVTNTVQNIINQGGGGDGPPGPTPIGTKTYGKTFTGMTMPDGTPIGSSGIVAGPGIIDSLKNAATDLYGLYQKFSPIGIISNFMKQRAEKQKEIQNNAIEKARKEREMQEAIAEAERKERERAAQYGATNYGQGVGGQSYSGDAVGAPGLGFGVGATTGGPVSNRTGRGRQDYSKGGLATMFKEKR